MKTIKTAEIAFSRVPPSTLNVFARELDIPLPQGVQLSAFPLQSNILPAGIVNHRPAYVEDTEKSAALTCDVVLRVEQDRELAEALGEDLKERLTNLGFIANMWLLHQATHRYAYAYVRVQEKSK